MSKISDRLNSPSRYVGSNMRVDEPCQYSTSQEHIVEMMEQNQFDRRQQKSLINQEIDKPSHYGSKSGRDVIDWCEDFGMMENAYVFNIFKYLCRAGRKKGNSELQDALKARVYLDRYIQRLQKECGGLQHER